MNQRNQHHPEKCCSHRIRRSILQTACGRACGSGTFCDALGRRCQNPAASSSTSYPATTFSLGRDGVQSKRVILDSGHGLDEGIVEKRFAASNDRLLLSVWKHTICFDATVIIFVR